MPVPSVAPTDIIVSCRTPKLRCRLRPAEVASACASVSPIGLRRRSWAPNGSLERACSSSDEDTGHLSKGSVGQTTMSHIAELFRVGKRMCFDVARGEDERSGWMRVVCR